jgi:hypothetical protein
LACAGCSTPAASNLTEGVPKIVTMFSLDSDPGEEPRPDAEPSQGMETEDELAEDLTPPPSQGLAVEDQLEGAAGLLPPEEDEDGGGMETEHETRSPAGRGTGRLLEPFRR